MYDYLEWLKDLCNEIKERFKVWCAYGEDISPYLVVSEKVDDVVAYLSNKNYTCNIEKGVRAGETVIFLYYKE